jgi:hypothetical protein
MSTNLNDNTTEIKISDENADVCPICRNTKIFPFKLSCGHEFCYMCLKGCVIRGNSKCPYCRKDTINVNFEDNSYLPNTYSTTKIPPISWLYSGKNHGWWCYDVDNNCMIEKNYQKFRSNPTKHKFNFWILGCEYTIDFSMMKQISSFRSRDIKRIDTTTLTLADTNNIKGISGLKFIPNPLNTTDSIPETAPNNTTMDTDETNTLELDVSTLQINDSENELSRSGPSLE